jgi:argininosuccinate lyase
MKMWSGRFRQPLDAQFERWQRSFDFDRRLLRYELAASAAHARALKSAAVLSVFFKACKRSAPRPLCRKVR